VEPCGEVRRPFGASFCSEAAEVSAEPVPALVSSLCPGDAQAEARSHRDLTRPGPSLAWLRPRAARGDGFQRCHKEEWGNLGNAQQAGFQPLLGDAQHYVSAEEALPSAREQKQHPELGKQRQNWQVRLTGRK